MRDLRLRLEEVSAAEPFGRLLGRSGVHSRALAGTVAFADDERHDLQVGLGDLALGHLRALVHDRDAVADTEQILQPMGDQDHAHDPGLCQRRMRVSTASTSATASADVGSSMIRTCGSNAAARAMAID